MSMIDYFNALERLEANKPIRVAPGSKITNDNVSLEAGRKKGSIRKEREEFATLRNEIRAAAARQVKKSDVAVMKEKVAAMKKTILKLEVRLAESYNREILLIARLHELDYSRDYSNVVRFPKVVEPENQS
jgi:hypothetical protein